jgi:choice-of-anchor B domain-containing protein
MTTSAEAQISENVTLLSTVDNDPSWTSDIWGYSGGGREIAIIGGFSGTQFYDVTNPASPVLVKNIASSQSIWREIKTYSHYVYIVNDDFGSGGRGLQIVDMANPLNPVLVREVMADFTTCHAIYIDTALALCFCVGAGNDTHIYRLTPDPSNPVHIYTFSNFYIHDMSSKGNVGYAAAIYDGFLATLNLASLPGSLPVMDTVLTDDAFTHNAWVTEDGRYALCTDEVVGGHITVVDVTNPNNISRVASYNHPTAPGTIVHNVYVRGDYAYASWYEAGLEIIDVSNPLAPARAGYYDTFPSGSGGDYDGAWGTYPFAGGSNIVYVSDISTGLYVLHFDAPVSVPGIGSGGPIALELASANPFRSDATVRFDLENEGRAKAAVYDGQGRLVRRLSDAILPAGAHEIRWDGTTERGSSAGPGVYVVRLETNEGAGSLKVVKSSTR